MKLYIKEELCCGCSACKAVCPRKAINIVKDEKGFLIPHIDDTLCVDCGLCVKTCPLQNHNEQHFHTHLSAYAAMHKNDDVRIQSRSGGVFMALAEWVISQQGTVYGAVIGQDLTVIHKRADNMEDCKKFQGSKYVQSDVQDTFLQAANDLIDGKYVLYSGTGCQIDGFISFINAKKISTEKLITCDIVCHGNASPEMFKDYIDWCEKKYHGKITDFDFRDKSIGWAAHMESFVIGNKKYLKRGYTELFYCNSAFRASCYICPYARKERAGDFTLADCWGIKNKLPDMFDNKGISLLLVNSPKAENIMNNISGKLKIRKVSLTDFLQPQLRKPIDKSPKYQEFWDMYHDKGFESIIRTFGKQNPKDNLKRWVKNKILKKY